MPSVLNKGAACILLKGNFQVFAEQN